jgi:type IV secretory pathway VirB10-like protein
MDNRQIAHQHTHTDLQNVKLVCVDFTPRLLQTRHRTHVHTSCERRERQTEERDQRQREERDRQSRETRDREKRETDRAERQRKIERIKKNRRKIDRKIEEKKYCISLVKNRLEWWAADENQLQLPVSYN